MTSSLVTMIMISLVIGRKWSSASVALVAWAGQGATGYWGVSLPSSEKNEFSPFKRFCDEAHISLRRILVTNKLNPSAL